MKIVRKVEGSKTTLALDGRLDTASAPDLEKVIGELDLDETKELILDFEALEYVSSAGLRVILTAQKKVNAKEGKMKVVKANDVVRDVFDVTGFSNFIEVEK